MKGLIRKMPWGEVDAAQLQPLLDREWLVTNGLGGYASGTVSGISTRRYHGLLVAALPGSLGRMLMLAHLSEMIWLPGGKSYRFGGHQHAHGDVDVPGARYLTEFRLETGMPVWRYEVEGVAFEKQVLLPHQQNTVYVLYRLVSGNAPVRLTVMPSLHFRSHDAAVDTPLPEHFTLTGVDSRYEICAGNQIPALRMLLDGNHPAFTSEPQKISDVYYQTEASRGYESQGDLWSPGYFRAELAAGSDVALVASTEPWEIVAAMTPEEAYEAESERRRRLLVQVPAQERHGMAAELMVAADQFIITPAGRVEDAARVRAAGDEARTVIAGYHWFTDWGRDTMISLDGLALATGRHTEARYILRTFAYYLRDGLIPNLFPEGGREGLYHTADATLWFFHAVYRYFQATGDRMTLELLLPKFLDIVEHHRRGTRFGIGIDPQDGLMRQGAEGYQLTWMDAKVGDWVVTPRRGKAVELNALWYNALRVLESWLRLAPERSEVADRMAGYAEQARQSFNRRFWYAEGGYLYDVVDGPQGDDTACRPNQLFAISLPYPVLDQQRWQPVLEVAQQRLLTPVGLRSLAPGHPDYKPQYYGDLRARDAAYHQGTVWAWLIGPFVDAYLRVHPDDLAAARRFLEGFEQHLSEACIGTISEVFDAEPPYTPRGCAAQAWSVAEVLRCWLRTASPTIAQGNSTQ